jgi:hypothetical protein
MDTCLEIRLRSQHAMRHWLLLSILVMLASQMDVNGGTTVKILNLEKLNSEADEEDPCPTPDGNGLLYAKKVRDSYDIYAAKRSAPSAPFSQGKPFIFDKLADERSPYYYKEKYYFATNETADDKFAKLKNFDLKKQIGFQAPLYVEGDVNSASDEMYPWISPAGKEFYFSRKTEEGWKLYVANGPVPGPIGKAKLVGFGPGFHRATLLPNGLTMYLQGPLEDGKIGIYRSKRAKASEKWSPPEEVKALNHADSKKGDMQPALTADGSRLYFVSDRPGGKGGLDIWTVLVSQVK